MYRIDRRLIEHFDIFLLFIIILVCSMALFNLYSASMPINEYATPPYVKQIIFMVGGLILFFAICSIDYKMFHTLIYLLYAFIIISLLAAEFIGSTAGGAQRWINLGFFNFQPSELAKLILVITLASFYSKKEINTGYSFVQILIPLALAAVPFLLIAIQPDLGTALMLVIIFISISVFVKLKWSTYLIFAIIGIPSTIYCWFNMLKPYQKKRVEAFLNPDLDPMDQSYQITQSKIAIGSGGITGSGYMQGTQGHLHFLPERHTDFAFAVWGEEWGFIGSLIFLACYFMLLLWGIHVGMNAKDRFGTLLAYGVVVLIFWQAVINLFMILGWLPVVGIPLPLVSYGGSSLLTTIAGLGILMNVRMRRFHPMRNNR